MKGLIVKMAKKRKYHKRKTDDALTAKVIGTIVFSVLLAILLYTNSGALGQYFTYRHICYCYKNGM